jgi:predicted Zn finger-like uncharacterized protein
MGLDRRQAPMSLTTRCPNCGTAFRVQPTQLSARGGKVRCGRCANVFDGVAALVQEGAAGENAAPLPEAEPSPQLALFESAKKLPPLSGTGDAANEDAAVPQFLDEQAPPKRRALWGLAALLALVVLAGQAALQYRAYIAALVPDARPWLTTACALIGCEMRLPRDIKLIQIESSELKQYPSGNGVVQLDAAFRNTSPLAQEFPVLMLTLTDAADEILARRAIPPQQYLQPADPKVIRSGVPGASVVNVRLFFDNSQLRAIGYRIALVYPT